MTITKSYRVFEVINDWFYFLLAIPVVTALILTEQFGMVNMNIRCFEMVTALKSRQSEHAMEWSVRNHIIACKKTAYYEDIF